MQLLVGLFVLKAEIILIWVKMAINLTDGIDGEYNVIYFVNL